MMKCYVALLAEGVDRNSIVGAGVYAKQVALLAEGVDRNPFTSCSEKIAPGRPPRGGRG